MDELSIAYALYLAWLGAGLGDFLCHRRADLPRTSGVAESAAHLVQIGLLGIAVVLGLAFEIGRATWALLVAIVGVHALVGYVDTRIAFARRRVSCRSNSTSTASSTWRRWLHSAG